MRIGTAIWTVALGGLCIASQSDALGPVDLISGVATVEAAPIDPSKDPVYICPIPTCDRTRRARAGDAA